MEGVDKSFHAQGSAEWFAERLGKFTSSEMHCLMVSGRSKTETFGQGAKTYIMKKLNEIITGQVEEDSFTSTAMDWGNAHEFEAIEFYSNFTGNPVDECGFVSSVGELLSEIHGGSPDGDVYNKLLLEVKCPYNGTNHVANLALNCVEDFQKLHPKYYTQIQSNLLATEREMCDFISYDPRPKVITNRMKILRIYRDEGMISEMESRIISGYEILCDTLSNIIHNAQVFEQFAKTLKITA